MEERVASQFLGHLGQEYKSLFFMYVGIVFLCAYVCACLCRVFRESSWNDVAKLILTSDGSVAMNYLQNITQVFGVLGLGALEIDHSVLNNNNIFMAKSSFLAWD